jgi:hypothetical protein
MTNDFSWLDGYKSMYRLWTEYSVELLQAIRAEIVIYERWNELKIIDKIIAQKAAMGCQHTGDQKTIRTATRREFQVCCDCNKVI